MFDSEAENGADADNEQPLRSSSRGGGHIVA